MHLYYSHKCCTYIYGNIHSHLDRILVWRTGGDGAWVEGVCGVEGVGWRVVGRGGLRGAGCRVWVGGQGSMRHR